MTTTIERRFFGKLVETDKITNAEKSYPLDLLGAQVISVHDKAYAKTTTVQTLNAPVGELLRRAVVDREYPEWQIKSELSLSNGQTIEIGPKRCHLTIHREA